MYNLKITNYKKLKIKNPPKYAIAWRGAQGHPSAGFKSSIVVPPSLQLQIFRMKTLITIKMSR